MPEMLRWPFRIVLYFMLYVTWTVVTLLVLAVFPSITYFEAVNLLPAGWIVIAAALLADLYTQLRVRNRRRAETAGPC